MKLSMPMQHNNNPLQCLALIYFQVFPDFFKPLIQFFAICKISLSFAVTSLNHFLKSYYQPYSTQN